LDAPTPDDIHRHLLPPYMVLNSCQCHKISPFAMSMSVQPPAYSSALPSPPSPTAAPPVRHRVPVKHSFHLTNGKGSPWVTLNVTSKARSPDQAPTFVEGDPIVGSVELDSQVSQIQEMEVFVSSIKWL
jgi:hypothetical protein